MNFDQARENMIKQQIRTENVVDDALLDVLSSTLRDQFVPEAYRELAYADMNIPLGDSRTMLTPSMEAILLDALAIAKHWRDEDAANVTRLAASVPATLLRVPYLFEREGERALVEASALALRSQLGAA